MVKMLKLTGATVAVAAMAQAKVQADVKASEEQWKELKESFVKEATQWREEFMRESPWLKDMKEKLSKKVAEGKLTQESMDVIVKTEEARISKQVKEMKAWMKGDPQTQYFLGYGKDALNKRVQKMLNEAYKSPEGVAEKKTTEETLKQVQKLFDAYAADNGVWGMVSDEAYTVKMKQVDQTFEAKKARVDYWTKLIKKDSATVKDLNKLRTDLRDLSVKVQRASDDKADAQKAYDEAFAKAHKKQLKKLNNMEKYDKDTAEEKEERANNLVETALAKQAVGQKQASTVRAFAAASQKLLEKKNEMKTRVSKLRKAYTEEKKNSPAGDYCYHFGACKNEAVDELLGPKADELYLVVASSKDEQLKSTFGVNGDSTDNDIVAKAENADRVAQWAKDLTKAIEESDLGNAKKEAEEQKKQLFRSFKQMLQEKQVDKIVALVKQIGGVEEKPVAAAVETQPQAEETPAEEPQKPEETEAGFPTWAIVLLVLGGLLIVGVIAFVVYSQCAGQQEELDDL